MLNTPHVRTIILYLPLKALCEAFRSGVPSTDIGIEECSAKGTCTRPEGPNPQKLLHGMFGVRIKQRLESDLQFLRPCSEHFHNRQQQAWKVRARMAKAKIFFQKPSLQQQALLQYVEMLCDL